ncbi:MAG: FAD-dependent oxidoreductase [Methylovulum sp.]|nr:FAD-dependent oxidoreductase [Methylovulum sp.]
MLAIAIVGAGLSGLALAGRLLESHRDIAVFEARSRCGGRILSPSPAGAGFAVDLGPTWVWPAQQPRITALAGRLGLELFRQWDLGHSLYQNDANTTPMVFTDTETHADARRIKGGCGQLVAGLVQGLPDEMLHMHHQLLRLTDCGTYVELEFKTGQGLAHYQAQQVVLAVPPRLLAGSVVFEPALAPNLLQLMQGTPTWMAGHAKAMLVYKDAFWRRQGYSGNAWLHYPGTVLAELYDACTAQGEASALFGFFGLPAALRASHRDGLEAWAVQQTVRLFGTEAASPLQVIIQDWSAEPFTATEDDLTPPTSHPVYGHRPLCLDHWQDKLYFCGTETAQAHGGYLEGALEASERVFAALALPT